MGEVDRSTGAWGRASREPPPTSPARVAGGLLGVLAGDRSVPASQTPVGRDGDPPAAATAVVDLSRSCADGRAGSTPEVVASGCVGLRTPAWLLPVAVACPDAAGLVDMTTRLVSLAGVPDDAVDLCVTYVRLASFLLAATPGPRAVEVATGAPASPGPALPGLTGHPETDALGAAVWALSHPRGVATAAALAPRAVSAAAAGLVGLRDGLVEIPLSWHRHPGATGDCLDLAYGLLRARASGTVTPQVRSGRDDVA